MDWATLIAELVKAVAWPAATLGIVLLFRRPISGLIERLRQFEFRGLRVIAQYDEELSEVKKGLPDRPEIAVLAGGPAPTVAVLPSSEDAQDLLQHAPAGAVIAAWAGVEGALLDAAKKVGTPSVRSASATAYNLREVKALESATYESIRGLQRLRNLVVHGGPEARERLGADRAREFVALAEAVQFSIERNVVEFLKQKTKS